jgi:hypothetical protein
VRQIRADIHAGEDHLLAALPGGQRRALLSATHTISEILGRSET